MAVFFSTMLALEIQGSYVTLLRALEGFIALLTYMIVMRLYSVIFVWGNIYLSLYKENPYLNMIALHFSF